MTGIHRDRIGSLPRDLRAELGAWCARWDVPGLEAELRISISRRLRTSLGRCSPRSREIRIASFLLDGPLGLLREVLCHEAAHVAAHELHGAMIRPHGVEWKALMRQVGYAPRARMPAAEIDSADRRNSKPRHAPDDLERMGG